MGKQWSENAARLSSLWCTENAKIRIFAWRREAKRSLEWTKNFKIFPRLRREPEIYLLVMSRYLGNTQRRCLDHHWEHTQGYLLIYETLRSIHLAARSDHVKGQPKIWSSIEKSPLNSFIAFRQRHGGKQAHCFPIDCGVEGGLIGRSHVSDTSKSSTAPSC